MSDLQKYLIVILAILGVVILGHTAGDGFLPPITDTIRSIPSLLAALPGWIWWVFFGVSMSLTCPLKIALFGRSCRRSRFGSTPTQG